MLVLTQLSVGGFAVELVALAAGSTGGFGTVLSNALLPRLRVGWAGSKRPSPGPPALRLSRLDRNEAFLAQSRGARVRALRHARHGLCRCWLCSLRAGSPAAWGVRAALLGLVVATGSAGVACSVLVYHVVQRPFWRAAYGGRQVRGHRGRARAGHRSGGPGHRLAAFVRAAARSASSWPLTAVALGLIAATSAKLWFEARLAAALPGRNWPPLRKTALLLVVLSGGRHG